LTDVGNPLQIKKTRKKSIKPSLVTDLLLQIK